MKQILLMLLIIVLAMMLVLSLWGYYAAIHPFRIISHNSPKDFNVDFETVTFTTADGIALQGWFIKSPDPQAKTIILLHGYPADKGDVLPSRLFLHPHYHLFFFDFRYFGQSGGTHTTIGKNEILDLLAAIKYLQTRGIHEVGVWGLSMGGSVALMTAPQAPEIKAIVAEASYARLDWMAYEYYRLPILNYVLAQLTRLWGLLFLQLDIKKVSPILAAEKLNIPVLLIHSKSDNVVPFAHGLALQAALSNNPQAKVIFPEYNLHGEPMENYQHIIKDFFDRYLTHETAQQRHS